MTKTDKWKWSEFLSVVSQKQAQNDPEAPNTSTPTTAGVWSCHLVTHQSPGATQPTELPLSCLCWALRETWGRGEWCLQREHQNPSPQGACSLCLWWGGESSKGLEKVYKSSESTSVILSLTISTLENQAGKGTSRAEGGTDALWPGKVGVSFEPRLEEGEGWARRLCKEKGAASRWTAPPRSSPTFPVLQDWTSQVLRRHHAMFCFTSLHTLFSLPEIHCLSFLPGQLLIVLPDPDQMPAPPCPPCPPLPWNLLQCL